LIIRLETAVITCFRLLFAQRLTQPPYLSMAKHQ
jgi:hypothetical protein